MNLENGQINGRQLIFLIMGYILGSSVILPPGTEAGNSSWLAIFCGAGEGLIIAFIFTVLARRFPNQTAVQFNSIIYGPYLGSIVSVAFLWYIFNLGSIVTRNFTDFIGTVFMPETPTLIVGIAMIFAAAFAVYQGVEVIALSSVILVPLTVVFFLISYMLQINTFDLQNLLPFLDVPMEKFLGAAHGAATFPFAEIVVFLMIFPYLNPSKLSPMVEIAGISFSALVLSLSAVRTIAVLGNTAAIFTYPSFEALKLLNLPFFNARMEIIVGINFMTMGFLKITILYYGTVLGIAQLFGLRRYQILIIPVGILMLIFSMLNFNNIVENMEYARITYPIYALLFQVWFPLITLGIAMIRRQGGAKE
jgi:spore germination protein KB